MASLNGSRIVCDSLPLGERPPGPPRAEGQVVDGRVEDFVARPAGGSHILRRGTLASLLTGRPRFQETRILRISARRQNADGKRHGALALGPQLALGRSRPFAMGKTRRGGDACDRLALAFERHGSLRRGVEERHVLGQIGNLLPGLRRVEGPGKDEDANGLLGKLLQAVDEREPCRQAVLRLDEGVSRQKQEIDAAIQGDADQPLEGGPRRILHDRRDARRQRKGLSNRLIKADVRGVRETAAVQMAWAEPPFSRQVRCESVARKRLWEKSSSDSRRTAPFKPELTARGRTRRSAVSRRNFRVLRGKTRPRRAVGVAPKTRA